MIKINTYISKVQYKQLKAIAKRTGIKLSEHIRRALDVYCDVLERDDREQDKNQVKEQ